MNYEQEEEFLTNDLSRKLAQVKEREGGREREREREGGREGEREGGEGESHYLVPWSVSVVYVVCVCLFLEQSNEFYI